MATVKRLVSGPARSRGWLRIRSWPLSAQVMLALAFSLLPLGILALLAGIDNYRDVRASQSALAGVRLETVRRAVEARLDQNFATLQVVLIGNASTPDARADCDRQLTEIARATNDLQSIMRVDAGGRLLCASTGDRMPPGVPAALGGARDLAWGRFAQSLAIDETTPARDLLIASRDVGPGGSGDIAVGRLGRKAVSGLLRREDLQPDERIELRRFGETLAAWGPNVRFVAPDKPAKPGDFVAVDGSDGKDWRLGVVPIGVDGVEQALAKPAATITPMQVLSIALPALMWIAAVVIGWLTIGALVVDPLLTMRGVVDRYRRGDAAQRVGERFANQEMALLGSAFDRMADEIGQHERELQDALDTQKKLTREVHHRVKNNLQIVASLLSLQSRDAPNPDVAYAYATIQKRVNALALVHRWLFDDEAMRGVDLRSLAQDLCAGLEQSVSASEGAQITIASDVERLYVGQDTAVPLAFLITELVTSAGRRAQGLPLPVRVAAKAGGGRATLVVEAPSFRGRDTYADGSDPAARIVQGMARQMRSKLVFDAERGAYLIDFPLAA
jgi:two-component sensor histidine kinase